jgi:hypothetical protein
LGFAENLESQGFLKKTFTVGFHGEPVRFPKGFIVAEKPFL